jgi:hypothetical protein
MKAPDRAAPGIPYGTREEGDPGIRYSAFSEAFRCSQQAQRQGENCPNENTNALDCDANQTKHTRGYNISSMTTLRDRAASHSSSGGTSRQN